MKRLLTIGLMALALAILMVFLSQPAMGEDFYLRVDLTPTPNHGPMMDDFSEGIIDSLMNQSGNVKFIDIDSPGGSLDELLRLLSYMDLERNLIGTKFSCYVSGEAYSAAFILLTQCDYRYMRRGSTMMWHPARVLLMGYLTTNQLVAISGSIFSAQLELNGMVSKAMGIPWEKIEPLYLQERVLSSYFVSQLAPDFAIEVDNEEEWIRATEMGWLYFVVEKNE